MDILGTLKHVDDYTFVYSGQILVKGERLYVVAFETNSKQGKTFDIRVVANDIERDVVIRSMKEKEKVVRVKEPDPWDDITKLIPNKPKQQSLF